MSKRKLRKLISLLVRGIGNVLSVYVGVYMLIISNLVDFFGHVSNGDVTPRGIAVTGIQIFASLTVGGFIWVLFDILATKIRGLD